MAFPADGIITLKNQTVQSSITSVNALLERKETRKGHITYWSLLGVGSFILVTMFNAHSDSCRWVLFWEQTEA